MAGSRYHEGKSGGEGERKIHNNETFSPPLDIIKAERNVRTGFFSKKNFPSIPPWRSFPGKIRFADALFSSLARDTMTHRLRTHYARYSEKEHFASFHCTVCTHTMFSRKGKKDMRVDSICSSSLLRRSRPSNSIVFEDFFFLWVFHSLFAGEIELLRKTWPFLHRPLFFKECFWPDEWFFPYSFIPFFKSDCGGFSFFLGPCGWQNGRRSEADKMDRNSPFFGLSIPEILKKPI